MRNDRDLINLFASSIEQVSVTVQMTVCGDNWRTARFGEIQLHSDFADGFPLDVRPCEALEAPGIDRD